MKSPLVLLLAVILAIALPNSVLAADDKPDPMLKVLQPCPKTTMIKDCFECHIKGSFKVKETKPDAHLDYPNGNTRIVGFDCGQLEGYYTVKDINADQLQEALDFYKRHNIKNIVMELFSPGGSMFHGIKMTALMDDWYKNGGTIETRVYGIAASAAFMVFVNGTPGRRFMSPQSHIMWHEVVSAKMFDISSPSDKEDEARILRHFQNTANEWLTKKSKLTKDDIDAKIRKKEYWMNGTDAVKAGFADGFIGAK